MTTQSNLDVKLTTQSDLDAKIDHAVKFQKYEVDHAVKSRSKK